MANADSRRIRIVLVVSAGVMAMIVAAVAPPHKPDGMDDLAVLGLDKAAGAGKAQGIMKP